MSSGTQHSIGMLSCIAAGLYEYYLLLPSMRTVPPQGFGLSRASAWSLSPRRLVWVALAPQ
jgi:hypothetical protein